MRERCNSSRLSLKPGDNMNNRRIVHHHRGYISGGRKNALGNVGNVSVGDSHRTGCGRVHLDAGGRKPYDKALFDAELSTGDKSDARQATANSLMDNPRRITLPPAPALTMIALVPETSTDPWVPVQSMVIDLVIVTAPKPPG